MSAVILLKYVGWQALIALLLCIFAFAFGSSGGARSSVLGSIIALVPNAYFTLQAFRYKANEEPVKAFAAIYRGQAGRYLLVAVLSALTFNFIEIHSPLLLMTSLVVMLLMQPLLGLLVFPVGGETQKAQK